MSCKAIIDRGSLQGALLVISDVTKELKRLRRDAEPREVISMFERVMSDRAGFIEFFTESEALVNQVVSVEVESVQVSMRALHTLKGNCGLFGVS